MFNLVNDELFPTSNKYFGRFVTNGNKIAGLGRV